MLTTRLRSAPNSPSVIGYGPAIAGILLIAAGWVAASTPVGGVLLIAGCAIAICGSLVTFGLVRGLLIGLASTALVLVVLPPLVNATVDILEVRENKQSENVAPSVR